MVSSYKTEIVRKLSAISLTVLLGMAILGYFGEKIYKHYTEVKITEIIYASARTKEASTKPADYELVNIGEASNVESDRHIKTAASTY